MVSVHEKLPPHECQEADEPAATQDPVPVIPALPIHEVPQPEPQPSTWRLFLLNPPTEPLANQPFFALLEHERVTLRVRSAMTDTSDDDAFGEIDLFGDLDR